MNQILYNKKNQFKKKKLYFLQFCISIFFVICIFIYFLFRNFSEYNISKISEATNKSYSITRLYSNKTNSNFITDNQQISIIGTIKIPKINISYPIFSKYSDEILKVSVCKFYGPSLNSSGNFCIIGHNYNNGKFFSDLPKLKVNDIIELYDSNLNVISYFIYDIYEVEANNLKYLDQDTNRKKRSNFNYL